MFDAPNEKVLNYASNRNGYTPKPKGGLGRKHGYT